MKTLAAGTLNMLRGMTALVDKHTANEGSQTVAATTVSSGGTRKLVHAALLLLQAAVGEHARKDQQGALREWHD